MRNDVSCQKRFLRCKSFHRTSHFCDGSRCIPMNFVFFFFFFTIHICSHSFAFHSSHSLRGGQRVPHGLDHRLVLPRRVRSPHPEPAHPRSLDGFLLRVGTVSAYQNRPEQISTRTYLAL